MMKATEIMNFIREACEEKQEREQLYSVDYWDIDLFLDRVEDLTNYVSEHSK